MFRAAVVHDPTLSPFLMDDSEFEAVTHRLYQIKTQRHQKVVDTSTLGMHKQVRSQIAIMYELLGLKKSIDFEEIERGQKMAEI